MTLAMKDLTISLLHISPETGAFDKNLNLVAKGMKLAAFRNASLVICPELCLSGYGFSSEIGLGWITSQPDSWMSSICKLAGDLGICTLLSHPERDETGAVYNSAFLISDKGSILGCHRKVNVKSDRWSSPGSGEQVFLWNGIRLGILICADAYNSAVAERLARQGAQLLLSTAAWGPGPHGPAGEWEQRTLETRLPLIVCNRTGEECSLSFREAESLVVKDGRKLLSHSSAVSTVLTFDWDLERMLPTGSGFTKDPI
jgi:predicted amidohydrolase